MQVDIIFGGQQAGEGGRVAALQVDYFSVSQGPACVQNKVHGQSGSPPQVSRTFPSLK